MNFGTYPHPCKVPILNSHSIQRQLTENNKLMTDAFVSQSCENFEKSYE